MPCGGIASRYCVILCASLPVHAAGTCGPGWIAPSCRGVVVGGVGGWGRRAGCALWFVDTIPPLFCKVSSGFFRAMLLQARGTIGCGAICFSPDLP